MGNSIFSQECLQQDRLIDGENEIFIGIVGTQKINPFSSQAIRIGHNGKLRKLENFIETQNCLRFEFESNTTLTLTKREKNIIINLKEPETNKHISKPMDSICREIFKPISWGNLAIEYDKIPNFIRPEFEDLKTEIGKSMYDTANNVKSEKIER
jgi:hypothetical protein